MTSNKNDANISVIIPAYNAARFISAAIDSVFEQSLQPCEILVIDDGSTDNTVLLVEKYGAPVRLLRQEHRGVSSARNMGIHHARGEYIAFLDADDVFIEPAKLRKQVEIIIEKNCDIVISGWRITDDALNKVDDRRVWLEAPHLNLFNWLRTVAILPSAMLLRRSKLLEVNGFDEELTNSEDVDLIFRMALAGSRAEWLPEITVAYRKHAGNASNQIRGQIEGMNKVIDKLFQRHDLPVAIRQVEGEIRYHRLIWSAYECFLADDFSYMKKCLLESREFARFSRFGLLMNWFYSFERFSTVRGMIELDADRLLSSNEWQELENIISVITDQENDPIPAP